MKVTELNRDQLVQLKQDYLCDIADKRNGESPSWYEIANADALVSDKEVFDYYAGIDFVPEDFHPEYDELPWWEKAD